jgi:hypothetical protein
LRGRTVEPAVARLQQLSAGRAFEKPNNPPAALTAPES